MFDLTRIASATVQGNMELAQCLVRQALEAGVEPVDIIQEGLIAGMDIVGQKFRNDEIFIPEVLLSVHTMHSALAIVRPLIIGTDIPRLGKVIIATVKGDLHDIGKNLVAMMLESAGFSVIDLGVDVSPGRLIEAAQSAKPDIVALSALLTTTMEGLAETIRALEGAGIRSKVKVMVGGAPVTQEYAERIGADGWAPDAGEAVERARSLLGLRKG